MMAIPSRGGNSRPLGGGACEAGIGAGALARNRLAERPMLVGGRRCRVSAVNKSYVDPGIACSLIGEAWFRMRCGKR